MTLVPAPATAMKHHRVSQLATLINGFPFDSGDFSSEGDVPLVRIRDLSAPDFETFVPREKVPAFAFVRNGDVVIGMDGDFNSVIWDRGEAALNQRVCLLRSRRGVDPRYVAYAIPPRLQEINDLTWSTTVKHLSAGSVRAIRVPAHSAAEQRAIADYLDRETAQIDAFIAKNEELITLLTERKRAILPRAIDNLAGDTIKLRYLYSPSKRANHPDETVLSVYREYGVVVKSSRSDNFNVTPENLDRYLLVRPNDVVVNRMKAWQGSLGVAPMRGIVSGDYEVLRPRDNALHPSYANHLLRSSKLIGEYGARSTGIRPSQWRLYWDQMGDIRVTIPPRDVQERVAREIDERIDAVARGIGTAERVVSLARERRAALISAAVTGKIDVGVAA